MSEVLFEKELIRKTAEELEMSENKIQHHLNFMKDYLEDLMNRDDVHSIQFPHVGTMYRNIKACAHMIIYIESFKPEYQTEKKNRAKEKSKRDIEHLLGRMSEFENFSLHNSRRRLTNPYFTCIMKKKELEKFQNAE